MGSYSGAKAAIKQRLVDNWTTTRIAYQNKVPAEPWPPMVTTPEAPDVPEPAPWVFLEITTMPGGGMRGAGTPGQQVWVEYGFILVHVFVPTDTGDALATEHAETIGEIYRGKKFYDDRNDGCYVRTWAPRVDEGGPAVTASDIEWANNGSWHRVTMSCPFEYWHLG